MSTQLYRGSKLGDCLVEALDELINQDKINPDLAMKVLAQFDKSMVEAFQTKVHAKTSFKGHLDNYRFCDNVWTFNASDVTFKTVPTLSGSTSSAPEVKVDKVKIVCVDAKVTKAE